MPHRVFRSKLRVHLNRGERDDQPGQSATYAVYKNNSHTCNGVDGRINQSFSTQQNGLLGYIHLSGSGNWSGSSTEIAAAGSEIKKSGKCILEHPYPIRAHTAGNDAITITFKPRDRLCHEYHWGHD